MSWEDKYKLSKSKQIKVRWKSSLSHCTLSEQRLGAISEGSSSLRFVKDRISMFLPPWHSYCQSETGASEPMKTPDQTRCWPQCPSVWSKMEEGEGKWTICCRWLHGFHLKDSPLKKKIVLFFDTTIASHKMMVTVWPPPPFFFLIILLGKNLKPWVSIIKS